MVVKAGVVLCALLLVHAAEARPVWAPKYDVIHDPQGPRKAVVGTYPHPNGLPATFVHDKGALFNFNSETNENADCSATNARSGHACYCKIFTDNPVVGKTGSDAIDWFILGVGNCPIKRLGVYAGADFVTGIQVWFFDGTTKLYGRQEGVFGKLNLYAYERFTEMSVWGNGQGRIGAIVCRTSRGQYFKWGMTRREWRASYEVKIDVSSGIMMNMFGWIRWSDNTLYSVGYDFMRITKQQVVLKDIVYNGLQNFALKKEKTIIWNNQFTNFQDSAVTQTFSNEDKTTKAKLKHFWGVEQSMRFSNEFAIIGSRPEVVQEGQSELWKGVDFGPQTNKPTYITPEFSFSVTYPAHKTFVAEAYLRSNSIDVEFWASFHYTLTTGATYSLKTWGYYKGRVFKNHVLVDTYEVKPRGMKAL